MTLLVRHTTQVPQPDNPDRAVSATAWNADHEVVRGDADLTTPLVNRVRDRISLLDYATSAAARTALGAWRTAVGL